MKSVKPRRKKNRGIEKHRHRCWHHIFRFVHSAYACCPTKSYAAISLIMTGQNYSDIKVNMRWPGAQSYRVLEKLQTSYTSNETPGQDPRLNSIH